MVVHAFNPAFKGKAEGSSRALYIYKIQYQPKVQETVSQIETTKQKNKNSNQKDNQQKYLRYYIWFSVNVIKCLI